MSFMEKSIMLQQLTNAMNSNRERRLQEQRELEEMNKNNDYLKDVLEDYKKYHGHIAEQKSQFSGQLNKLVKHLEKEMKDAGLSDQQMRQAKFERNRILSQLDKIKMDIDNLITKNK